MAPSEKSLLGAASVELSLCSGNANLPFPNTGRSKKEMTTVAEVVQTFQTICAHLYQTRTDVYTFSSLAECSALSSPV